tara:strand:- start:1461 stop:2561 length:1101 start_codon:yes stop_codon:yes gene_type:complete
MKAYDVCVIGGGINGVAIAERCGAVGLRTVIFEKSILGAGASTKTSKLAHGGLRYLEQFQFGLVKEALQEREVLLQMYPDVTQALPFVFPVYKGMFEPKVWLGLKLYDFLAGSKSVLPKSKRISTELVSDKLSWLDMTNVKSGYMYWDAVMNDYEILQRAANSAQRCMVDIFEHEPVEHYDKRGAHYEVTTSKRVISARLIVNVTGAWANAFHEKQIVRPSKGVHIVTDSVYTSHASILRAPQDNRVFFTIPQHGSTIIGTTDTYYDGDLDDVKATSDDIKYLLLAFNSFSNIKLGLNDILYTYAGLRPLACKSNSMFASSMSRDVRLIEDDNVLTLVGGKYTTHRSVARKTLKLILKRLRKDYLI